MNNLMHLMKLLIGIFGNHLVIKKKRPLGLKKHSTSTNKMTFYQTMKSFFKWATRTDYTHFQRDFGLLIMLIGQIIWFII